MVLLLIGAGLLYYAAAILYTTGPRPTCGAANNPRPLACLPASPPKEDADAMDCLRRPGNC